MRSLRRLKPKAEDNFDILVPEAGRSFLERLTNAIAIAIVPISSIALVVAGIVVMNMMLVSVTERTREIGIRKSLGARNSDVLVQILFESTLLTIIGGGIGLVFSYLGTFGLSKVLDAHVHIPLRLCRDRARHRGCHRHRCRFLSGLPCRPHVSRRGDAIGDLT